MLLPQIKPKLPSSLAYPLKALDLAPFVHETAAGFPVELRFSETPTGFKSVFASLLRTKTPYAVVRMTFIRWDKSLMVGDQFERQLTGYWNLTVYPVSAELNAPARLLLVREGLPAVVSWIGQRRRPTWYHGRRAYDVILDLWNGRISFEEDRVAV